jgi:chromosome segregation protein
VQIQNNMGYKSNECPIKYTCPDIDIVQKQLKECADSIEEEYYSESRELRGIISDIEDLRDSNSGIRQWGEEQSERADKAENDLNEAEEKISELEYEIIELKRKIEEYEAQETN